MNSDRTLDGNVHIWGSMSNSGSFSSKKESIVRMKEDYDDPVRKETQASSDLEQGRDHLTAIRRLLATLESARKEVENFQHRIKLRDEIAKLSEKVKLKEREREDRQEKMKRLEGFLTTMESSTQSQEHTALKIGSLKEELESTKKKGTFSFG